MSWGNRFQASPVWSLSQSVPLLGPQSQLVFSRPPASPLLPGSARSAGVCASGPAFGIFATEADGPGVGVGASAVRPASSAIRPRPTGARGGDAHAGRDSARIAVPSNDASGYPLAGMVRHVLWTSGP